MIFALQNQTYLYDRQFPDIACIQQCGYRNIVVNGLGQIFECNQTKARGLYKKAKSCGILQYT